MAKGHKGHLGLGIRHACFVFCGIVSYLFAYLPEGS